MKIDRQKLEDKVEKIIADGVICGEEIDKTTKKILDEFEIIIRAAEYATKAKED